MKLQIASDLHLDTLARKRPGLRVIEPAPEADLLVLAGDIDAGTGAVARFAEWPVPVLYVPGNHEYYDAERHAMRDELARAAAATGGRVTLLDDGVARVGGVRFIGSTLWTDYTLDAAVGAQQCMQYALLRAADHRLVREGDERFMPQHALAQHRASRAWLEQQLAQPHDGPTVVITHHGCHPGSVHARFAGNPINGAFVTDLSALFGPRCALWIHGHVHNSFDYRVAGTRVVVNPRGYWLRDERWENPEYDPQLVVQV